MVQQSGIFGVGTNLSDRLWKSLDDVSSTVECIRKLGTKTIVLTQGTFDLAHPGHARYLEKARGFGDFLIVGVDSDAKTRARKGPERPLIPEGERIEMLAHFRHVDALYKKELDTPKWALIKAVRPDVLVISTSTKPYSEEEQVELKKLCGRLELLEPQATTSASARVRKFQMDLAEKFKSAAIKVFPTSIEQIEQVVRLILNPPKKKEE